MKEIKKKYWRASIELQDDSLKEKLAHKEFENEIPVESFLSNLQNSSTETTSRRDFLKWVGFGTAAATLAACKGPVIKSIPYVVKPESITPGVANYYASTFFDGFDLSSVLVKTREGRPIKIESNRDSKYFNASSARMQASLLSLYDETRLKNPFLKGKNTSWEDLDTYVVDKLKKISETGKQIVILSSSLPSPSTKELISDFSKVYHTSSLVIYDGLSYSCLLDATQEIVGIRAIPYYNLENTELLVSFEADFLGDFSPQNLESEYAKARKPTAKMMRHIQVESNMSLSGANADQRIPLKPSETNKLLVEVYRILEGFPSNDKLASQLALEIKKKGSKALVLAGSSKEAFALSLLINQKIKSQGLSKDKFIYTKESDDRAFNEFLKNLKEGHVGAVLFHNCDPIYSLPNAEEFKESIKNLDLSLSFSMKEEDSSKHLEVWAPTPHWLESWGDTRPMSGFYTLMQPTIQPLFNTRSFQDSLLSWANAQKQILEKEAEGLSYNPADISVNQKHYDGKIRTYYDYLRNYWEKNIIPKSNVNSFNKALFDGSALIKNTNDFFERKNFSSYKIDNYLKNLSNQNSKGLELKLYTKTAIGDGKNFNNPWLQELPDPITRTSWDNYLTISSSDAKKLDLKNWHLQSGALNGDVVDLKLGDTELKNVPVYIQPGQATGSIGLALGYGQKSGKLTEIVKGINAYLLYKEFNLVQSGIEVSKTKGKHEFACVQLQHTMAGRTSIARETELEKFLSQPKKKWNEEEKFDTYKGKLPSDKLTLWREKDRSSGHHFNLSIDLNSCTGCAACVVACHVENNVPVVGKEEIRNSRDMHWLRIDRYYSSEESFETLEKKGLSQKNMFSEPKMYSHLLEPEENNPQVIFQPVMCQHCNNAPCETVCPVAATSHGSQGQNMMAYNRCVGTRYCANNCPYKVRRFNWFNYAENDKFDFHMNNDLGRMVLNPDVVVRSRGVMEKCSMCIQMSQATILEAKKEKRKIKDEEFQTACAKACPSSAIEFGDINNKESKVSKQLSDDRSYKLLDFVGTRPNVFYQVKIRNSKSKEV